MSRVYNITPGPVYSPLGGLSDLVGMYLSHRDRKNEREMRKTERQEDREFQEKMAKQVFANQMNRDTAQNAFAVGLTNLQNERDRQLAEQAFANQMNRDAAQNAYNFGLAAQQNQWGKGLTDAQIAQLTANARLTGSRATGQDVENTANGLALAASLMPGQPTPSTPLDGIGNPSAMSPAPNVGAREVPLELPVIPGTNYVPLLTGPNFVPELDPRLNMGGRGGNGRDAFNGMQGLKLYPL